MKFIMGTKNNPGKFDCYANAEPDEPMFIFLARDPAAPFLVEIWEAVRRGNYTDANDALHKAMDAMRQSGKLLLSPDSEKRGEAIECSRAMQRWFNENRPPIHNLWFDRDGPNHAS